MQPKVPPMTITISMTNEQTFIKVEREQEYYKKKEYEMTKGKKHDGEMIEGGKMIRVRNRKKESLQKVKEREKVKFEVKNKKGKEEGKME